MRESNKPVPLAYGIIAWFAFLGPIGTLIPIPGAPPSFRFYYLMLVPGICLFAASGLRRQTVHNLLILSPVLLYMLLSSFFTWFYYQGAYDAEEGNAVVRFLLFAVQLVFTLCAGEEAWAFSPERKLRVLGIFLRGYFVSMIVGYVFFIGFYTHHLSAAFLSHFEVLVQWAFGILRFSPGSYPNEYGIVSSFVLSVLTLLLVRRRDLAHCSLVFGGRATLPRLLIAFLLTLGALFLATTRAAYIAYLLSLFYIAIAQRRFGRSVLFLISVTAGGLLLLACIQPFFNVIGIFEGGYRAFFAEHDVGNGRLEGWRLAFGLFLQHPYWGAGFGSVDMMHNVYLQLLFGTGIIGFTLLLLTALALWARARALSFERLQTEAPLASEWLLRRIAVIALLHIAWFAMSNHNLNHFLTWFGVLLAMMSYRRGEALERVRTPEPSPIHAGWRVLPSKGD